MRNSEESGRAGWLGYCRLDAVSSENTITVTDMSWKTPTTSDRQTDGLFDQSTLQLSCVIATTSDLSATLETTHLS